MQEIYKVLSIPGRENAAGQPIECMVCVNFEMALDHSKVKAPSQVAGTPYLARLKMVSYKDKAAFEAGKMIDSPATTYIEIPIQGQELQDIFAMAFDALLPAAAAQLGATVEEAVFGEVE